jgi:hypothetical protein
VVILGRVRRTGLVQLVEEVLTDIIFSMKMRMHIEGLRTTKLSSTQFSRQDTGLYGGMEESAKE